MPVGTANPIVRQLHSLAQEYPDLREAAEVYVALLPILHAADLHVTPLAITQDQARAKMEKGIPLLQGADLALDDWAARNLMVRLARTLEDVPKERESSRRWVWQLGDRRKRLRDRERVDENEEELRRATSARQIRLLLEQGKLDAGALLARVGMSDLAWVIALAENWQLDAGLLWTLAQHALTPALRAWYRRLTPLVGGVEWHQSDCFVCGTDAILGELQGNEVEKHLRCGQCGADWVFQRMQCVFCGNENHKTLSHFYSDTQREKLRVDGRVR
jgi:Protein involved in formate dehydrogenase formation